MPEMVEAMTEKEPIDAQANVQSLPRLRPSSPACTSLSLPLPGAAQLLTLPASWPVPLLCAQNLLVCLPHCGLGDPPTEVPMGYTLPDSACGALPARCWSGPRHEWTPALRTLRARRGAGPRWYGPGLYECPRRIARRSHGTHAPRPLASCHWAPRCWSNTWRQTPRWRARSPTAGPTWARGTAWTSIERRLPWLPPCATK